MASRDVIVVGASAGGIEALSAVLAGLPAGLPAAVLAVVHLPATGPSRLAQVLGREARLPVAFAADGEPIRPGRVYLAPPNLHLLVRPGAVELARRARENGVRPAADPLFRTAARAYGPRVIGVVLSGSLDDGTAGLMAVRAAGGLAVVQDPDDALFPGMPRSAIAAAGADRVAKAADLGPLLARLAAETLPGPEGGVMPAGEDRAEGMIGRDLAAEADDRPPEGGSVYTCPDCGGHLWQASAGRVGRYHCHSGHQHSLDTLLAGQAEELEAALWRCVRMLTEKAVMTRQFAARARAEGRTEAADRIEEMARLDDEHIRLLRATFLETGPSPTAQSLEVERLRNDDP